jgi:hypothetical protein
MTEEEKADVLPLPLKKPEIIRDEAGRFDRHGKTLSKTAKKTGLSKKGANSDRNALGQLQPGSQIWQRLLTIHGPGPSNCFESQ